MKLSHISISAAALAMTACASIPDTTRLQDSAALKASSGSVISILEKQPGIMHNQSSKAAFGVIGGLANVGAANDMVRNDNIVDPAASMEATLKSYLTSKTGLTTGADLDYSAEGVKKPKKLQKGEADYVLDVTTLLWGLNYFATNWTNYQTYYTGDVTLFNGETGDIVAQNVCQYKYPETAEESPSYKELTENNAALFKANIKLLADRCVDEFKTKALGF